MTKDCVMIPLQAEILLHYFYSGEEFHRIESWLSKDNISALVSQGLLEKVVFPPSG